MSRPDHPRACGANLGATMAEIMPYGSSPRVRGKPLVSDRCPPACRIIPARAGQTPATIPRRVPHPDHPRACGANSVSPLKPSAVNGSSPRVRGKHRRACEAAARSRIIPARAGQTTSPSSVIAICTDHPRACGANLGAHWEGATGCGSSPRVRGKHRVADVGGWRPRIIPARAGQTPPLVGERAADADHPRACGANFVAKVSLPNGSGSSPRVRGKHRSTDRPYYKTRIIPARAGQT